ncbi:hypothetical protein D9758_015365 [Tetrapyrgos nigripes]|uniref:Uncharacterized protein n=1 Tax=Tetrapyrgos nigripes TaxID=182062 RepID=A0A8H5CCQ1_9AGAR|nr:hypothetical protein D9758_015365 [Tetrapyrgos nigripes]
MVVGRVLRRYFSETDIWRLRVLQYEYGILIGGSTALQFFDLSSYPDSDLDLYVNRSKVKPLLLFIDEAGYTFQPTRKQSSASTRSLTEALAALERSLEAGREPWDVDDPSLDDLELAGYIASGIDGIFNFVNKGGEKIQVITTPGNPVSVILKYHSTCVQNLITHSHAYSLFPRTTFENRMTVKTPYTRRETDRHELARRKWEKRGWTIVQVPSAVDFLQGKNGGEFRAMRRYVGDSSCWTIPLEPINPESPGMDVPMSPDHDFVRANAWENRMMDNQDRFYFDFGDKSADSRPGLRDVYCYVRSECNDSFRRFKSFFSNARPGDALDSDYMRMVHEACSTYSSTRYQFDCQTRSELRGRVQRLVSNAFLNMPSFPGIPYECLPKPHVVIVDISFKAQPPQANAQDSHPSILTTVLVSPMDIQGLPDHYGKTSCTITVKPGWLSSLQQMNVNLVLCEDLTCVTACSTYRYECPTELEFPGRVERLVSNAFLNMPSFPDIPYDSLPKAPVIIKLTEVLFDIFMQFRFDPQARPSSTHIDNGLCLPAGHTRKTLPLWQEPLHFNGQAKLAFKSQEHGYQCPRFSTVSEDANFIMADFNGRSFQVGRVLRRYFSETDIWRLRVLQYEHGILIGGSTAFDLSSYPDSDLDLYINRSKVKPLLLFIDEAGYTFQPTRKQSSTPTRGLTEALAALERSSEDGRDPWDVDDPSLDDLEPAGYAGNGIDGVFNFVNEGGKKIQVITTLSNPVSVILKYHSKPHKSHAYSLFPRATFENRMTVKTPYDCPETDRHELARRKWEKRGWTIVQVPSAVDFLQGKNGGEFWAMRRYIGDSSCWTIPLEPINPDTPGMDVPMSLDYDLVRANAWENRMMEIDDRLYFSFRDQSNKSRPGLRDVYCCANFPCNDSLLHFKARPGDNLDSKYILMVHEACSTYRYNSECQTQSELRGRVQRLVSNAFLNMPSFPGIPYESLSKARVVKLTNVSWSSAPAWIMIWLGRAAGRYLF